MQQQNHSTHGPKMASSEPNDLGKGKVRVFVYGSLKRGHHNNGLLTRHGAEFLGIDSITGPYSMLSFGGFPGIVMDDRIEGAVTIYGEVYAVDNNALAALDWLEGYPRFYDRDKVRTDVLDRSVWVYHIPYDEHTGTLEPVPEGVWHPTEVEIADWKREHRLDLTAV